MSEEMQINVAPEALRATAEATLTAVANAQRQYLNMQEIMDRSTAYWQGDAATRYRALFAEQKEDILSVFKSFRAHAQRLKSIAANYNAGEAGMQSQIQGLPNDIL